MSLAPCSPQLLEPFREDVAIRRAHLVGIGGSGMKPLAYALLHLGIGVSGSDPDPANAAALRAAGATVYTEHAAENVGRPDAVVYSSAIPDNNPELIEARRLGIRLLHRSELLAWFLLRRDSVLVAGTHGKTTTTAMVTLLLEAGGLNPWGFIGGSVERYGGNLRVGGEHIAVAEADESDGTFLRLPRNHAIITNIEPEHLNYWESEERLFDGFIAFAKGIPDDGRLILSGDDRGTNRLREILGRRVIRYGMDGGDADYRITVLEATGSGSLFTLERPRGAPVQVRLAIPGLHNVSNAAGACALAESLGADLVSAVGALGEFHGVKRRFTRKQAPGGYLVIDDYGHHPTEISATMSAARLLADERGGRLLAVFQPHRFSRTQQFFHSFAPALSHADQLILTQVYAAGESPLPGISGESLRDDIASRLACPVQFLEDFADIKKCIETSTKIDDIVLLLGAGSVTKLSDLLCSS